MLIYNIKIICKMTKQTVNKGLIPLNERSKEERTEIARQGGSVKSPAKTFAVLITTSKMAKCKHCKVNCYWKETNLNTNPEMKCVIPRSRAIAIRDDTPIVDFNEDQLKACIDEVLQFTKEQFTEKPDKEVGRLFWRLTQTKEKWFPATQRNVNLNIGFNDFYDKWHEKRKKEMEEKDDVPEV